MPILIDIEAFVCENNPIYRQLSWVHTDKPYLKGMINFYNPHIRFNDLSEKDKRTNSFIYKRICGLKLVTDRPSISFMWRDGREIENVLRDLYSEYKCKFLYNRGNLEKNILNKLNIPNENIDVPKSSDTLLSLKPEDVLIKCKIHQTNYRPHCSMCDILLYLIEYKKKQ